MTEKKKRLGRGLESLLSPTRPALDETMAAPVGGTATAADVARPVVAEPVRSVAGERVVNLAVEKITRNPHQPRKQWDDGQLMELAESIKANGLIQPILVRAVGEGYQLIAGERRLRGAQLAGKATVAAIVRDASEEQVLEWALVENIHRADLNALERARAYQNYMRRFSLTQQEVAQRLGEDRSTVANYLRLLEMSAGLQQMVVDGQLSMGHARALLGLSDVKLREEMAREAVARHWSVREVERRVQAAQQGALGEPAKAKVKSANVLELEGQFSRSLGTRVTIQTQGRGAQRGKIVIDFFNLDDFDRIKERMCP